MEEEDEGTKERGGRSYYCDARTLEGELVAPFELSSVTSTYIMKSWLGRTNHRSSGCVNPGCCSRVDGPFVLENKLRRCVTSYRAKGLTLEFVNEFLPDVRECGTEKGDSDESQGGHHRPSTDCSVESRQWLLDRAP